jgi:CofD-related protein of GAK system
MAEGGTTGMAVSTNGDRVGCAPQDGPRILFFTGGSALRQLSRHLKSRTHRSIHIVSPFDSGGSSARLREAFGMIAVGDMRNRLLSLVDDEEDAGKTAARVLSLRLPVDETAEQLRGRLQRFATGQETRMQALAPALSEYARHHLQRFLERMPADFDLRAASLGNLVLANSVMEKNGDIEAAVAEFERLALVRGRVVPVADAAVTLVAILRSGARVVGQHRITGKEVPPVDSPIQDLYLTQDSGRPHERATVMATQQACDSIESADLICYPMGSFFTSVLANLLPRGIGRAIRRARCRKVYVPNPGPDPEEFGLSLEERVQMLLHTVWRDGGVPLDPTEVCDTVLIDSRNGRYGDGFDPTRIERLGIQVRDLNLTAPGKEPRFDPHALSDSLLSLATETLPESTRRPA